MAVESRAEALDRRMAMLENHPADPDAGNIQQQLSGLEDQITALSGRVQAQPAPVAGQTALPDRALDALTVRLAALEGSMAQLSGVNGLTILSDWLRQLEHSPDGQQQLTATVRDLNAHQGDDAAAMLAAAQVQGTLGEILGNLTPAMRRNGLLLVGVADLNNSRRHGAPFDEDVRLLEGLLGDAVPAALKTQLRSLDGAARRGVPDLAGLQDQLQALEPAIVDAGATTGTYKQRALAKLGALVQVSKGGRLVTGSAARDAVTRARRPARPGRPHGRARAGRDADRTGGDGGEAVRRRGRRHAENRSGAGAAERDRRRRGRRRGLGASGCRGEAGSRFRFAGRKIGAVRMLRILWFAIKLGILVAAAVWIADLPGDITLRWQDYDIHIRAWFALALGLLLLFAALLLHRLVLSVLGLTGSMTRYREARRQRQGQRAILRGMTAVAAGDRQAALHQAQRARRLLPEDRGLTLLLEADAARLAGDAASARRSYAGLLESKDTAFLGMRGLLGSALEKDDSAEALALARKAAAMHPKQPWLARLVYRLEILERQWEPALRTLRRAEKTQALPGEEIRRDRQALLLTLADAEFGHGRDRPGLEYLKQAYRAGAGFPPAAVALAEYYLEHGQRRAAVKLISRSWALNPHPELAALWGRLAQPARGTDGPARLRWMERLTSLRPDDPVSLIAAARAAADDRLWGEARQYLDRAEAVGPTAQAYLLRALIEEELQHPSEARHWQRKAADSRPRPGLALPRDGRDLRTLAGGRRTAWRVQLHRLGPAGRAAQLPARSGGWASGDAVTAAAGGAEPASGAQQSDHGEAGREAAEMRGPGDIGAVRQAGHAGDHGDDDPQRDDGKGARVFARLQAGAVQHHDDRGEQPAQRARSPDHRIGRGGRQQHLGEGGGDAAGDKQDEIARPAQPAFDARAEGGERQAVDGQMRPAAMQDHVADRRDQHEGGERRMAGPGGPA